MNYEKKIENQLDIIISEINNGFYCHTYCSGISGFLWSLKYMIYYGVLDEMDCDIFNQFRTFLYTNMKEDLKANNWDFFHGAIGVGLFFMSDRVNDQSLEYVNELIIAMEDLSTVEHKGIFKWKSSVISNGNPLEVYNLGLAHGIPSIIAFLTKAYKNGINKEKSQKLLMGAIKYVLKNQNDVEKTNCYFPNWISDDDGSRYSRLAWCYGDLGIAVTLYNAAKVLDDISLEDFALKVLRYNTFRRDLESVSVIDAGLCHGTAGIAHIFYRMYWNTREEIFRDAATFWFDKTLEMSRYPVGLAGYKAVFSEEYGGTQNDYGILEGIAGIGLAMHSWITQTEPTWDECLLLS
jgi:lantibiotic modifying enzyme